MVLQDSSHKLWRCEPWCKFWQAEAVLRWHYEGDKAKRHVAYWQSGSS